MRVRGRQSRSARDTVERTYCSFEVRRHAPRVVAETTLPGPADQAGNQAFKVLASYIFGMSKGEQKIAMTGLVMRRREGWIEVGPAP